MYRHILIPTDGSPLADKAVEAGIEFAREAGARVTLFTAVPEYEVPNEAAVMARHMISIDEHNRRSEKRAQEVLDAPAQRARAAGVAFDTAFTQSDRPYKAIIDAAVDRRCDAIFMSTHGRKGIARVLYGSETEEVLSHSTIPTLVFR